MHSFCGCDIHRPRVATDFGGMDPAAARWNKLCGSAARSPPSALAAGSRGLAPACAHGTQDVAPPGLNSQPDHNSTLRANLNTVPLRVSESPWFNLPFDFMRTDESGELPALVAGSNAERLCSKPFCGHSVNGRVSAVRTGLAR